MSDRTVTIGSRVGLHARPAAIFAKRAAAAPVAVRIAKDGTGRPPVSASNVLNLLTLGAGHGDRVTLSAEGEGADAVLDELAALLESDMDSDMDSGPAAEPEAPTT